MIMSLAVGPSLSSSESSESLSSVSSFPTKNLKAVDLTWSKVISKITFYKIFEKYLNRK